MSKIVRPDFLGENNHLFFKSKAGEKAPIFPEEIIEDAGGHLHGQLKESAKGSELASVWFKGELMTPTQMLVTDPENDRDFRTLEVIKGLQTAFLVGNQDPEKIQRLTRLIQEIVIKSPQAPILVISSNVSQQTINLLIEETNAGNIILMGASDVPMMLESK